MAAAIDGLSRIHMFFTRPVPADVDGYDNAIVIWSKECQMVDGLIIRTLSIDWPDPLPVPMPIEQRPLLAKHPAAPRDAWL